MELFLPFWRHGAEQTGLGCSAACQQVLPVVNTEMSENGECLNYLQRVDACAGVSVDLHPRSSFHTRFPNDAFVACALLVPELPSTVDLDSVLLFTRC